jgi:hypothetical protein
MYTNRREISGSNAGLKCILVEVPEMAKDAEDWVARYTPREEYAATNDSSAS